MKQTKHSTAGGPVWEGFPAFLVTSWRPYLVLIILGVLVFGRTIWFGYTYFDDDLFILKHYSSISSISRCVAAFQIPYFGQYYRPILAVSFTLDAQISGTSPWMYHCSNVLYHLIASCLTFSLLSRLHLSRMTAFIGGVFFTINPIVTQCVAWIPGRNDSLLTIVVLLSCIALIRFVSTQRWYLFFVHLMLFFLCLLTKESALVFPFLCLYVLWFLQGVPVVSKKSAAFAVGWSLMILVWFLMRRVALEGIQQGYTASMLVSNLRVIVEMLGKMVLPLRMSPYPTFDPLSLVLGIAVAALVAGVLIVHRPARSRLSLFALLWFLLFILPSLVVHVDVEHRYHYLESRAYASVIGLSMFVAALFQTKSQNLGKWGGRFILLVVTIYALVAMNYSSTFEDPVSHWTRAVQMSPNSADAYYNLGIVQTDVKKDLGEAVESYKKAIALDSAISNYHNNLGIVYGRRGALDFAEVEFNKAIQFDSSSPLPHSNLGNLYFLRNDFPRAEKLLKEALLLDSSLTDAQGMLVNLYSREKKYDQMRYYADRLQKKGIKLDSTMVGRPGRSSR